MKQYLFTILLCIFAFGGVMVGYVYSSIDHLPKYKLNMILGSPEAPDVSLFGHYDLRVYSESLTVNSKGSSYPNLQHSFTQNILNTRSWFFNNADIKQLVKENRQFMRSKNDVDGFYNDESQLIYVEAMSVDNPVESDGIELYISRLHKLSKQVKEYRITVNEDHQGFTLNDVQLIDGQLHILATIYSSNYRSSDVYDYIVDLSTGTLISSNLLLINKTQEDDDHYIRLSTITERVYSAPSDFAVLVEFEEKIVDRQSSYSYAFERISERYYAYSYKTGEIVALTDVSSEVGVSSLQNNTFAYAINQNDRITLSSYDLATEQSSVNVITLSAQDMNATEIGRSMSISNNQLYILLYKDDIPMVAAIDANNGEVVYKGEVVFVGADSKAEEAMARLSLYNITASQ